MKDEYEIKYGETTVDIEKILKQFESGALTITFDEETAKQVYEMMGVKNIRAEDEFIKTALEKQIPKKPAPVLYEFVCPRCRTLVRATAYCGCCGQALDWSDIV